MSCLLPASRVPWADVHDLAQRAIVQTSMIAPELLARAVEGERGAAREVVAALQPVVESAALRVRVSLSKLRKLGLRPLLQRVESGQRLDPDVPVVQLDTGDLPGA